MFDFNDIDLQLQAVDLEEIGPKSEICPTCKRSHPKGSSCVWCFMAVHDSITMCMKLYNEPWARAPMCKLPN